MGHPQPPTPMDMQYKAAKSIINGTSKQKNKRNIHDILLGQIQNTTKSFKHILRKGKEKPSRLCHKKPPNPAQ